MFNKLFGKKKDGFYMQIDESVPPKAAEPEAAKAKEVAPKVNAAQALAMKVLPKAKAKGDVTKEITSQPEVALASVAAPEAPTTPETKSGTALVAEAPTEQKSKSTKTSIKKGKKDKEEDKKPEKVTIQPEVIAAAAQVAPLFTNFATDYLVTPAVAGNRRRPGANMKGFMSMARDVKDMKKGSLGSQAKAKAAKKTEA